MDHSGLTQLKKDKKKKKKKIIEHSLLHKRFFVSKHLNFIILQNLTGHVSDILRLVVDISESRSPSNFSFTSIKNKSIRNQTSKIGWINKL